MDYDVWSVLGEDLEAEPEVTEKITKACFYTSHETGKTEAIVVTSDDDVYETKKGKFNNYLTLELQWRGCIDNGKLKEKIYPSM